MGGLFFRIYPVSALALGIMLQIDGHPIESSGKLFRGGDDPCSALAPGRDNEMRQIFGKLLELQVRGYQGAQGIDGFGQHLRPCGVGGGGRPSRPTGQGGLGSTAMPGDGNTVPTSGSVNQPTPGPGSTNVQPMPGPGSTNGPPPTGGPMPGPGSTNGPPPTGGPTPAPGSTNVPPAQTLPGPPSTAMPAAPGGQPSPGQSSTAPAEPSGGQSTAPPLRAMTTSTN